MSDADNFVIENGVLQKYTGRDEEVCVPEGVREIRIGGLANVQCQ